jgi:hypothetical protein
MKGRYRNRVPLSAWVMFFNEEHCGQGHVVDLTAPGCQIASRQKLKKGGAACVYLPWQHCFFR